MLNLQRNEKNFLLASALTWSLQQVKYITNLC